MPGSVYFIRSPDQNRIKIGFTADAPGLRLRRLRATCPCLLEPIALMEGTPATEREVHARFASSWWNGEWFESTPELETFIVECARPWHDRGLKFKRWLPGTKPPKPPKQEVPIDPLEMVIRSAEICRRSRRFHCPDPWQQNPRRFRQNIDLSSDEKWTRDLTIEGVTLPASEWASRAGLSVRVFVKLYDKILKDDEWPTPREMNHVDRIIWVLQAENRC